MKTRPQTKAHPLGIYGLLATGFGLGLLPKAPGTWGSLLGLALGVGLYRFEHSVLQINNVFGYGKLTGTAFTAALLVILSVLAWWIIGKTEASWQTHDDGSIVLDEIIGQAIAVAFFPPSAINLIIGFIFFRVLDIIKPGPIGWADRELPGAWGTLIDDLLAGMGAAVVVWLSTWIS